MISWRNSAVLKERQDQTSNAKRETSSGGFTSAVQAKSSTLNVSIKYHIMANDRDKHVINLISRHWFILGLPLSTWRGWFSNWCFFSSDALGNRSSSLSWCFTSILTDPRLPKTKQQQRQQQNPPTKNIPFWVWSTAVASILELPYSGKLHPDSVVTSLPEDGSRNWCKTI